MRHIELDTDRCAGCSTCEAVCSLSHEGVVSPAYARLRITDFFLEGHRIEGHTCEQCDDAPCMEACATGALLRDKKTGAIVVDPRMCSGCRDCIAACKQKPEAAIFYDDARQVCFKCDLCGGEPLCVRLCPEAALVLSET